MPEKTLSIFIDESGDFGPYDHRSPYYLVALVLHDQSTNITDNICNFTTRLQCLGYEQHAVHTGPLIRRESVYINDQMEQRKQLFGALFNFARKLDFHYMCAMVKKSECSDVITMTAKLSRAIADAIYPHLAYLESFNHIIVYYDNGQVELTKTLTSVFNTLLCHVEFRKVQPIEYRLFQVADLVCTMELLALKASNNSFSQSEVEFFHSPRDFKKNFLKPLLKKKW